MNDIIFDPILGTLRTGDGATIASLSEEEVEKLKEQLGISSSSGSGVGITIGSIVFDPILGKLRTADGGGVGKLSESDGKLMWDNINLIGDCQKGTSGYTKLANGIIIQWSSGTLTPESATLEFPMAFPTACAVAIPYNQKDGTAVKFTISTTGLKFDVSSEQLEISYIAIGY